MPSNPLSSVMEALSEPLAKGHYEDTLKEFGKTKETLDEFASKLRLGVGISKDIAGKPELNVTIERGEPSKAHRATWASIPSMFNGVEVRVRDFGPTRMTHPRTKKKIRVGRPERLAPGRSVAHAKGYAATLGVFTHEISNGENKIGFISSSGALSLWGRASQADPVLSPGPPDGPRTLQNMVGTLQDFVFLVPANEEQVSYYNDADLSHVVLEPKEDFQNIVPSPWDPDDATFTLKAVADEAELLDYVNRPVFKVGRTTGLTRGTLTIIGISAFRVVGDEGKEYVFTNCALVTGDQGCQFSMAGDSGAIVYGDNGAALGNIIACNSEYTVIQPLSRGLSALGLVLA
jgi:hypothetical protein